VSFLGEHSYDDVRLITHNAEPDPDPDPDPDAADPSEYSFLHFNDLTPLINNNNKLNIHKALFSSPFTNRYRTSHGSQSTASVDVSSRNSY